MTPLRTDEKTTVIRLRVRGARLDPTLARLRMDTLLAATRMHPSALPPSAILCVRQLNAPSGGLQLDAPSTTMPRAWEESLTGMLDRLARQAARPIRGSVPASADAVVFADQSELLACLATDWCEETIAARWWWQSILKVVGGRHTLLSAWLDAPEYIPAALEHLSRTGRVVSFARALDDDAARALRLSVTRAHALDELHAALNSTQPDEEASASRSTEEQTITGDSQRSRTNPTLPTPAPWLRYVPESRTHGISLEQQSLLGIGLMLARAPQLIRASSFAHDARNWRARAQRDLKGSRAAIIEAASEGNREASLHASTVAEWSSTQPPRANLETIVSFEKTTRAASFSSRTHTETDVQLHENETSLLNVEHNPTYSRERLEEERAQQSLETLPTERKRPSEESKAQEAGFVSEASPGQLRPSSLEARETHGQTRAAPSTLFEARVETSLGGLFYLVNLSLFLELYGDFTTPRAPGLPLSIWDFVSLLGRKLLGRTTSFDADSVWPLLARLAGRNSDDAPGQGFLAPPEWRLPAAWLTPFRERSIWHWTVQDGRLRVRHADEGFLILDLCAQPDETAQQLERETLPYLENADFELRRDVSLAESDERNERGDRPVEANDERGGMITSDDDARPNLERWIEWVALYARARLRRALGLNEADDLAGFMCEQPARVEVTATHVDVVFELAALPLEIRLAGLDRNPGWVPSAGRFIAFHYV